VPPSPSADTTRGPADQWGERLPRRLGLLSAIAVVIGSTIGSGIYRTPAVIAQRVPQPFAMLSVWVLGGVLALCGALTYAELAAMYPRSGGVLVYLREGFGKLPAFLFGWTSLVIIRASALGAVATVFAEYLLRSLGMSPELPGNADAVHYIAAAAIAVNTLVSFRGVDWIAALVNVTTGARYVALALLVIFAFVAGHGDFGHYLAGGGALHVGAFGLALVSVLWAYDGWGDLSFVSGEVRDPERNLPKALVLGTLGVVAIYLAANAAYLYLIPIEGIQTSPLVAADAAERLVGRFGVGAVAVVVIISTFGTLAGSMLTGPRIFYAMAEEGLFFRAVGRMHPRYRTPGTAILLTGALGVGFVLLRTFEQLADAFVLGIWPFYALAAAAVFVLRRRLPDVRRPVRTWGYPVVPLLFLLAAVLILGNALLTDPNALIPFGVIAAGVPVYWVWQRMTGARGQGPGVRGQPGPEEPGV
jgi:APA family basic amino acid/polyamine antiporter